MEHKRFIIGSEANDDRKIELDSLGSKISLPVSLYDSAGSQIVPIALATSIGDNRKTVTTAGTAVTLAASTSCKKITVQALSTNTDVVVVGGSTVVAAESTRRGIALTPFNSVVIQVDNLADVYIDSVVSGEGVSFLYEI